MQPGDLNFLDDDSEEGKQNEGGSNDSPVSVQDNVEVDSAYKGSVEGEQLTTLLRRKIVEKLG